MLLKIDKLGKLGKGLEQRFDEKDIDKKKLGLKFTNSILIHPMELNVNYLNKIERPHKPVITFEIPVFNKGEKKIKGFLRVKYLANDH